MELWHGVPQFTSPESFEAGWGDWYASHGVWQIGEPTSGPGSALEGTSVAGTHLSGNYPDQTDSSLISPEFTLPSLPSVSDDELIDLRFWQWYSFGGGDSGTVKINARHDVTGDWTGWVDLYTATGASGGWVPSPILDVTEYADSTVRLAFTHNAVKTSSSNGSSSGWYIDMVSVPLLFGPSAVPTGVDLLPVSDTAVPDDDITMLDNSNGGKALQFEVSGTVAGATVRLYADDTFIGSALADGTTTLVTTNGKYDLVDGAHGIVARQAESGKIESGRSAPLDITVDTTAPRVTQVFVAGTVWTAGFYAALGDDRGWAIPDGADQLKSLPWANLDEFKIVLDEEVVVTNDDLCVCGVATGLYATDGSGFSTPDPDGLAGLTATWKLTAPVSLADKLLLVLSADTVTDVAGNALDGEWANNADTYNSGNGAAGGDFTFRLNVLPGDVSQNGGRVTALDWILTRARTNQRPGDAGYEPLYDSNGSGGITALDWILVRVRTNTQLPAGEPIARSLVRGVSAAASSQLPHTPAEHLVDGSGLLAGLHSTSYGDMWLSEPGASPTVQFDLGSARSLTNMQVWNYNQVSGAGTPLTNRGVQTADVYVSTTGIGDPTSDPGQWTLLSDDLLLAQATGSADYAGQSYELSVGGVEARYVLLTNVTNWGGTNTGLSEVKFWAKT